MLLKVVNAGVPMQLAVAEAEVESVHRPLLEGFVRAAGEGRAIVFVAGAPGSGKSTLCGIWQALADGWGLSLRTVSLDGFHRPNAELRRRGLLARKGAPETFDLDGVLRALQRVKERPAGAAWPIYDRKLHEPRPGPPLAGEKVVVVEGNYLLLDRPGWRELARYAAVKVMIRPEREALTERVIGRHVRGGLSREQAERKFAASDLANIILVEEHSLPADIVLRQSADGSYRLSSP